jgi:DNA-binding NarL/FixJ family response regulator
MKPEKRITVLMADDHQIVREGLRRILEAERDLEVICEASTGREAVEMVRKMHPDIVVMDIAMPLLNGLEATRQIRAADPNAKVLILSAHNDDAYVERAMEVGASGYLIKQTSAHFLGEAIRELRKGNTYFSPSISERMNHRTKSSVNRKGVTKTKNIRMTSRETEVLQLVAEGKSNKQVAEELGISVKTVEKHRDHLMQKLGIHDTAGLTRYAIEAGVIESSVQLTIA